MARVQPNSPPESELRAFPSELLSRRPPSRQRAACPVLIVWRHQVVQNKERSCESTINEVYLVEDCPPSIGTSIGNHLQPQRMSPRQRTARRLHRGQSARVEQFARHGGSTPTTGTCRPAAAVPGRAIRTTAVHRTFTGWRSGFSPSGPHREPALSTLG